MKIEEKDVLAAGSVKHNGRWFQVVAVSLDKKKLSLRVGRPSLTWCFVKPGKLMFWHEFNRWIEVSEVEDILAVETVQGVLSGHTIARFEREFLSDAPRWVCTCGKKSQYSIYNAGAYWEGGTPTSFSDHIRKEERKVRP